jgi:DNA-binding protein HU-beta
VLGEITAALAAGEKVTLVGFGSFEPVARGARTARNPRTGETVPVAATTVPRFHPGAGLRTAVDGGGTSLRPVGSLADGYASLVVPEAPAKAAGPTKAAKPAPTKVAKAAAKDDKHKGKGAKGKKSGKKK